MGGRVPGWTRWSWVGPLMRFAHGSVIRAELSMQRIADALSADVRPAAEGRMEELTAVVKTFERAAVLRRLLESIHRLYPGLKTIVVDDGREPADLSGVDDHVDVIRMPYDSGVSAGRDLGLRCVTTKYVLMLDDDFILFRHSGLREALRHMDAHPEIDLMGGKVINLPRFHVTDYRKAPMLPTAVPPLKPIGSYVGPFPVYDKVANFYVARTERLRLVGWDPRLKRIDHSDFFARAFGVLVTVYNEHLQCFHAQTPFDAAYMKKRMDAEADLRLLRHRYDPRHREGERNARSDVAGEDDA